MYANTGRLLGKVGATEVWTWLPNHVARQPRLKPLAAIRKPPASHADGQSGGDGPPERQRQVGDEPHDREGHPKDFALHEMILAVCT